MRDDRRLLDLPVTAETLSALLELGKDDPVVYATLAYILNGGEAIQALASGLISQATAMSNYRNAYLGLVRLAPPKPFVITTEPSR